MKKTFLFLLLNSCFVLQALAGGGWPQKKGNGYYKLSAYSVRASSHYTDMGLIDPNITSGIFNLSLYAEYGITDRFTAIGYLPVFSRAYANNLISRTTGETLVSGDALNTLGDADVGMKYGIVVDKKIALAGTTLLGIPLGKDNGNLDNWLQTGDKEFNVLLKMDAGTSFGSEKIAGYANAGVGYNIRTRGYSHEFRYSLEVGAGFFNRKLWTILRLDAVESLKNGTAPAISGTSIFANNTEYTSPGIEVAYYITDKLGISAGMAGAIRGELIYASPSYSFGVFLDLKKG